MRGLTGGLRRIIGALALGAGVAAGGAAGAVDIGVSVRFASVDGDRRYDPLAVVDTLGRPDLFFCYRQGGDWACDPSKITNRSLPVNAAQLECRNALRCVFRNLQLRPDAPFDFELRDADVTQNEIIESGTCRFVDTGLSCDTEIGNATLSVVSSQTNFTQQTTVQRQDNAWIALVAAMERDYRAAVPEESFAFCQGPGDRRAEISFCCQWLAAGEGSDERPDQRLARGASAVSGADARARVAGGGQLGGWADQLIFIAGGYDAKGD